MAVTFEPRQLTLQYLLLPLLHLPHEGGQHFQDKGGDVSQGG